MPTLTARCFLPLLALLLPPLADGAATPAGAMATPTSACGNSYPLPPLPDRPRVALVLSGGGARGGAHVGVLKVLEEYGIPVDLVVGTSMGSFVGALYASGMPLPDLEKVLVDTDWSAVLDDDPPRNSLSLRRKAEDRAFAAGGRIGIGREGIRLPAGAREGQNVQLLLRGLTRHVADVPCFAQLPLPFAAVATDAQTGVAVTLDHGDLVAALRASMAIPGYFSPVDIDGRLLVDGGVSDNLPVSVAHALGADIVIAVDITSPLAGREQMHTVLDVAEQMTTLLTRHGTDAERTTLGPRDVLLQPDLGKIGTMDYENMQAAEARGEKYARTALADFPLRNLAAPERRPAAREATRWQAARQPVTINAVQVAGDSSIPAQQIVESSGLAPGTKTDTEGIARAVNRVQGLDYFSTVDYRLDDTNTLTLLPVDRDWGPDYLKFGLGLYNDFSGIDRYVIGASYTATALNRFTGQFFLQVQTGDTARVHAEFFQPLSQRDQPLFVAPWVLHERDNMDFFAGTSPVARMRAGRDEAGIDVGIAQRFAELRLGAAGGIRRLDPVFAGTTPGFRDDVGYWHLGVFLDTFDQRDFPASGGLLRLNAEAGRRELGSEDRYDLGTLQFDHAYAIGRYALETGSTLKSQHYASRMSLAPMQLGGVLQMSAFVPGELSGDNAGTVRLLLRRPLNDLNWLRLHGGVALEYGGAWNGDFGSFRRQDLWPVASAFIGLGTPLGPLWLVAGLSENGHRAVQMQLGTRF